MRIIYVLLTVSLLVFSCTLELSAQPSLRTRNVITGLDTPWEILWGPDGWIWMTERGGRISRVHPDNGEHKVLLTLTDVHEQSESGLLGMALHPDFADSPFVYVVYNYSSGGGIAEKLVRFRYDGQALSAPQILLQNIPGYPTHDGSRLLVTPDRKLLMTTGDAQNQPGAQNHTMIVGKILRMNLDGSAPADNPFPGAPYPANYIWTTGHRNAQGLTIGPNGAIYSSEHGPATDDEVNIITARGNYGWPTVEGPCDEGSETTFCADSNVVEPIKAWTPTLAVAGLEFYSHTAIPEWTGSLLMTSLKESDLRQLKLSADGRRIVSETIYYNNVYGRLRDIAIAPDGRVFIATSNRDGRATSGFPKTDDDRIVEIRSATVSGATIFAPTITPTTLRGGDQVQVSFSAAGPFTAVNVFTIQISDASGSFDSPDTLGTLEGPNGGSITTLLPCDIVAGTGYRVRVVSSDPEAMSPPSGSDIVVTASPQPVVTGIEDRPYCPGVNVQLNVTGGNRPRWSPATGLSCSDCPNPIVALTESRTYIVTVINSLGCPVSDTIFFDVRPAPTPTITLEGSTLVAPPGYVTYEWVLTQSGDVVGSGERFTPTQNGTYIARVTDTNGCRGFSNQIQITSLGIVDEARNADLRVAPSPVVDRLRIELALGRAGIAQVELVDIRGATVHTGTIDSRGGLVRGSIDMSGLAAGAYVLRITCGEEMWVRRVVR